MIDVHTCVRQRDVHQVTKTLLAAVGSDEFLLIKGGLIMFNKLLEVRTVLQKKKTCFYHMYDMNNTLVVPMRVHM